MNRQTTIAAAVFIFLIVLCAAGRIASRELELPNFTPAAAISLFGAFYFSQFAVAASLPIAMMLASDLLIYGTSMYMGYQRWEMLVTVYAALLLPLLFRPLLRSRLSVMRVVGGAIGSATLFFAVTNFAQWYFVEPDKTLQQVYVDGLPFFYKGTLAGTLAFAATLFGGYALAVRYGHLSEVPATARATKQA